MLSSLDCLKWQQPCTPPACWTWWLNAERLIPAELWLSYEGKNVVNRMCGSACWIHLVACCCDSARLETQLKIVNGACNQQSFCWYLSSELMVESLFSAELLFGGNFMKIILRADHACIWVFLGTSMKTSHAVCFRSADCGTPLGNLMTVCFWFWGKREGPFAMPRTFHVDVSLSP